MHTPHSQHTTPSVPHTSTQLNRRGPHASKDPNNENLFRKIIADFESVQKAPLPNVTKTADAQMDDAMNILKDRDFLDMVEKTAETKHDSRTYNNGRTGHVCYVCRHIEEVGEKLKRCQCMLPGLFYCSKPW